MSLHNVLAELENLGAVGNTPQPVLTESVKTSVSETKAETEPALEESPQEDLTEVIHRMVEMTARAVDILEQSLQEQAELRDLCAEMHDLWLAQLQLPESETEPEQQSESEVESEAELTVEAEVPIYATDQKAVFEPPLEETSPVDEEEVPVVEAASKVEARIVEGTDSEIRRLEATAAEMSMSVPVVVPPPTPPGREAFYDELRKAAAQPKPIPVYQRR
jgi:hypothetical protein